MYAHQLIREKNNYQPVSRILFYAIIYLGPSLLPGSFCLPSGVAFAGIGRAALDHRYTWHFSMQGLPATIVTNRSRELLPHVFTLTTKCGSNFLWHCLLPRFEAEHPAVHRYIALCCPDFPSRLRETIARLVVNRQR